MRTAHGKQNRKLLIEHRRCSFARIVLCLVATILTYSTAVHSQDRAIIQQPGGSRFPTTGLVEDYTGRELVMQVRPGEVPRRYLRQDVIEVQTAYTANHEKGRRLLVEGRPAEAKVALNAALKEEDREWVRREILAQLVRCALWDGNYRAAVTAFLPIAESDPETLHFGVAPLAWIEGSSSDDVKLDARSWIEERSLTAKLIGASHLLFDRDMNDEAEATMRRLARDSNPALQRLAQMQLWRIRSAGNATTPGELARWETQIDELPEELRIGGYFVLGQAYRRQQNPERAAATLLWLPLVYDADRYLSARACFDAAQLLESFGDLTQATSLYSEVVFRFGDTPYGAKAEVKWKALSSPSKKDP